MSRPKSRIAPPSARTVIKHPVAPTPDELAELESLIEDWLTVPELAEALGLPLLKARAMVAEREVLSVRRGPNSALYVPAAFVADGEIVRGLPGLVTLLADSGYTEIAALRWLFTPDDTLPGTPAAALAANRGTEVKRRAQALAF